MLIMVFLWCIGIFLFGVAGWPLCAAMCVVGLATEFVVGIAGES